jgi:hypothetical protein
MDGMFTTRRRLSHAHCIADVGHDPGITVFAVQELLENVARYLTDLEVTTKLRLLNRECRKRVEQSQPLRRRLWVDPVCNLDRFHALLSDRAYLDGHDDGARAIRASHFHMSTPAGARPIIVDPIILIGSQYRSARHTSSLMLHDPRSLGSPHAGLFVSSLLCQPPVNCLQLYTSHNGIGRTIRNQCGVRLNDLVSCLEGD